jgi:uncharacterized membrane protein YjgN (DUF898 family)
MFACSNVATEHGLGQMNDRNPSVADSLAGKNGPWAELAARNHARWTEGLPPAPEPEPEADPIAPFDFVANNRAFLNLIMRGAVLLLVTLGFYRFWLTTHTRRFLWSHTVVDGDSVEYLGTARELVIGFLFALAVIVPLNLIAFLGSIEAESRQTFASFPVGLVFFLFGQFALYRARRYRLTRTVWRGVRFWMDGSGWAYAFMSFGLLILAVMSFGLLQPWRVAVQERYKMSHTCYGNVRGGFDGSAWTFFKHGILLWLGAIVAGIVLLSVLGSVLAVANPVFGSLGGKTNMARAVFTGVVSGLAFIIFAMFFWAYYKAIEWRWWAHAVHLGEARLQCSIRGHHFFLLYLKLFGLALLVAIPVLVTLGGVYLAVTALWGSLLSSAAEPTRAALLAWRPTAQVVGGFGAFLIAALAFGILYRYFMQYRYWQLLVAHLEIANIHALDGAIAQGDLAGVLGEGLADSLDVGGF